ncbi:MraY family glycosyltransferase [Parabacteroides sp. PFB2-10]|uniref:MraY family glycosyltransferase n=1 Tax=Parabacteroides sp. PFB2-10 TaxID=1742405 RepID=UPI0024772273|nr:MraY family glycosyltransferase [Parabacteroides sp. PFB2-10]
MKVLSQVSFFICGALLLYMTGVRDDLVGVRYRFKFLIQFIVASLLPASGLWLKNLNGLFGIYELAPWVGIPITVLLIVLIINAMNFIDGIDGLAGGLSLVSLIILSTLFAFSHMWIYAVISLATAGVLIPFLYYNMYGKAERQKKLFMGDTGSLTLGYLLAFLCLSLSANIPIVIPVLSKVPVYIVAFSTLFVPMFDVIRVMIVRMAHHKNPFLPDKNHIHHMLLAKGYNVRKAMGTVILMAYLYGILNILALSRGLDINLIAFANLLIWITFSFWLSKGHKTQAEATATITATTSPQPQFQEAKAVKMKEKRA